MQINSDSMENKKDKCLFACNASGIIKNGVSSIEIIDTVNQNKNFIPYKSNKISDFPYETKDSKNYYGTQTIVFKQND